MMNKPDQRRGTSARYDGKVIALVLLLLPVVLSLGVWQLNRAEQKQQLLDVFQQRQLAGPVPIETLADDEALAHRKVALTGEYDNQRTWLLDNRVYQGQVGYEVISPFRLAKADTVVLINRGWVAGDPARRRLPAIEPVVGMESLLAKVYVPAGKPFILKKTVAGDDGDTQWPQVIQQFDITVIEQEFASTVFPYMVLLDELSPGAYQANRVIVNITPEKHTGYAVQWFTMAFVLVVLLLFRGINGAALIRWCWNSKAVKEK